MKGKVKVTYYLCVRGRSDDSQVKVKSQKISELDIDGLKLVIFILGQYSR